MRIGSLLKIGFRFLESVYATWKKELSPTYLCSHTINSTQIKNKTKEMK
jgi:hypothetical protein